MAIVAIIKQGEKNVPSVVERIQEGDTFCFVVNQKALGWMKAKRNGRANMLDHAQLLRSHGAEPKLFPAQSILGERTLRPHPFSLEGA